MTAAARLRRRGRTAVRRLERRVDFLEDELRRERAVHSKTAEHERDLEDVLKLATQGMNAQLEQVERERWCRVELNPDRAGGARDFKGRVVWHVHCGCGARTFELPVPLKLHELVEQHLAAHGAGGAR